MELLERLGPNLVLACSLQLLNSFALKDAESASRTVLVSCVCLSIVLLVRIYLIFKIRGARDLSELILSSNRGGGSSAAVEKRTTVRKYDIEQNRRFLIVLVAANFLCVAFGYFTGSVLPFVACGPLALWALYRDPLVQIHIMKKPARGALRRPFGEADLYESALVPPLTTQAELERTLHRARSKLVLVDVYAKWCGPCRELAPFIEDLAAAHRGRTLFFRVDLDVSQELGRFLQVSSVPTLIAFKNREEVDRVTGAVRNRIENMVHEYGSQE